MKKFSDAELTRSLIQDRSSQAFEEIFRRHSPMVLNACRRILINDQQLAEDVAQSVFLHLYQKAPQLSEKIILAGWLYKAAIFAARHQLRVKTRRIVRENEAFKMNDMLENARDEAIWLEAKPILDEAITALPTKLRQAVILRFLENRGWREVAETLRCAEDAARKRAERGLARMGRFFRSRGVKITVASLGSLLLTRALEVSASIEAPSAEILAETIAKSLAPTASTSSALKIMEETMKVLFWKKIKTAALLGIGLLIVGSTGFAIAKLGNFPNEQANAPEAQSSITKKKQGEKLNLLAAARKTDSAKPKPTSPKKKKFPKVNSIDFENLPKDSPLRITIDHIDFDEANLLETLKWLKTTCVRIDPNIKALKTEFDLRQRKITQLPSISLSLDSIPLASVLRYLAMQTGLNYEIQDDVVIFSDSPGQNGGPPLRKAANSVLNRKLDQIKIDHIEFEQVTVPTTIKYLKKRSKELEWQAIKNENAGGSEDVKKTEKPPGVNFVLHPSMRHKPGTPLQTISLLCDDWSVREILDKLREDTNLIYCVEQHAVVLCAEDPSLTFADLKGGNNFFSEMEAWSKKDLKAASEYISQLDFETRQWRNLERVFEPLAREWAETDVWRGYEWSMSLPERQKKSFMNELICQLADRNSNAAWKFALQTYCVDHDPYQLRSIVKYCEGKDPAETLRHLDTISDPDLASELRGHVHRQWIRSNPAEFHQHCLTEGIELNAKKRLNLVRSWYEKDPEAVLAYFNELSLKDEDADAIATGIAKLMARKNPDQAFDFISENVSPARVDAAKLEIIKPILGRDQEKTKEFLKEVNPTAVNPKRIMSMYIIFASFLARKDWEEALRWAESLDFKHPKFGDSSEMAIETVIYEIARSQGYDKAHEIAAEHPKLNEDRKEKILRKLKKHFQGKGKGKRKRIK